MFKYQENNRFFAQIADSLEELGTEELAGLGAVEIQPIYRGLYFGADKATLYRVNYCSRLVSRVLAPLISFKCHSTDYLYKKAKTIAWSQLFSLHNTFAVFATLANSKISHSHYAALLLKDAIADYFREETGNRPNVETIDPNVWINLHLENNFATISLDTSGGSLHRRGYREMTLEAPMQETVAAAIIRLTEWDGSKPLYDPMCGSGTLLCEALMSYCRIPAGRLRKHFGFECLPDFDKSIWLKVKKEAEEKIRPLPDGIISGSDILSPAISAARTNTRHLPYGEKIKLKVMDFRDIESLADSIIVCNPPYGIRLAKEEDTPRLYKELGDFLKQRCQGSAAYIYFGNRELIKSIGLKPSWKKPLMHGGLDGRLVKIELY